MIKRVGGKIIIFSLILSSLYAQPRIQFKSKILDFGTMEQEETRIRDFLFRNVGNEDLKVNEVRSSCNCASGKLDISNRVVPPRGTGKMRVTFNSKNYTGGVTETIYIHTNDPENSKVELKLKANVKPPVETPPIRICFFYSKDCEECHCCGRRDRV